MCNEVVKIEPALLAFVTDHIKTPEMFMRQCTTGHGRHFLLMILGRRRRAAK